MKNFRIISFVAIFLFCSTIGVYAQEVKDTAGNGYKFTVVKQLPATCVKDQSASGTCWSFASLSFLESEMIRLGKGEHNLSEMFVVREAYSVKAKKYVRMGGHILFTTGGEPNDVIDVLRDFGMVPEEVYDGKKIGEENHVHWEMDAVLKSIVETIVKNPNRKLTPVWFDAFNAVLDVYLGKVPENFDYKGKKYTPKSFAEEMGLKAENYVQVTSFTHHPFYTPFILEVSDNWNNGVFYNVPMNDMITIIDNAIENGYTVAWGGDVSDKGFGFKKGVAIIPENKAENMPKLERESWEALSTKDKDEYLYSFERPVKEKVITQEMRQKDFDNFSTTDDHLMHIVGVAKDQNGNKFYLVKNSWGTELNEYKGYFYASEAYVKLKTTSFLINKEAIPKDIAKKLSL